MRCSKSFGSYTKTTSPTSPALAALAVLIMLCDICLQTLEGTSDPNATMRIELSEHGWEPQHSRCRLEIEKYRYGHHRTRGSLARSALWGCNTCCFFDENFPNATGDALAMGFWTTFVLSLKESIVSMHLRCGDKKATFTFVPVGHAEFDANVTFELDQNTDGPRSRARISQWLSNCCSRHHRCNIRSDKGFLPTRLLKIDNTRQPSTYRLVLRDECPPKSKYTTLSYCWGTGSTSSQPQLLSTTVAHLRQEQCVDALPKTFAEAMRVSTFIGVHYLWIDSLCIFQDSVDDWRVEASTMANVYRNSFLTISAVSGINSGAGLFYQRDNSRVAPTLVRFGLFNSVDKMDYRDSRARGAGWQRTWLTDGITTKRGWCVQERLLSPRVVHFGRQQLFWECREQTACEINPESAFGNLRSNTTISHNIWKNLLDAPAQPPTMEGSCQELYSAWYAMLFLYTKCNLTMSSDKLIAISGLADDMKHELLQCEPNQPHRYLAGLWLDDLLQGLCWSRHMPGRIGKRSSTYRAPSWSWASVDGPTMHRLQWPDARPMPLIDEGWISASTEYYGTLETGQVMGGRLEIRGFWTRVHVASPVTDSYDGVIQYFSHPLTAEKFDLPHLDRDSSYSITFDDPNDMPEEAFCMPLFLRDRPHIDKTSLIDIFGIVLVKVEKEGGLYTRVGLLTAYGCFKGNELDRAQAFLAQFEKSQVIVV